MTLPKNWVWLRQRRFLAACAALSVFPWGFGLAAAFSTDAAWAAMSIRSDQPVYNNLLLSDAAPSAANSRNKRDPSWREGAVRLLTITSQAGGHTGPVRAVAFHPNSRILATGSADRSIKVWNLETQSRVLALSQDSDVTCLAFSPDGRWLASGTLKGAVKIWDWQAGRLVHTLSGHEDMVTSIAFTPDSQKIISGSGDRTLKVWQVNSGVRYLTVNTGQFVQAIALDPQNPQRVASAGLGRRIEIWNWQNQQLEKTSDRFASSVYAVAWNPKQQQLAFSPDSNTNGQPNRQRNTVVLFDLIRDRLSNPLSGHSDYISFLEFSPSGDTLLSGSWDRTIKLWNAQTGELVRSFLENDQRILSGDFSANGKAFVVGSGDGTVKIYTSQE
ncbi:MAG: WD40 repeat domain-containing protein [Phormidesmis sp.]